MSRAVRNLLWLFLSNALTKLLWAGSLVLLMRHLGPEQYGLLAAVWAFSGVAAGMTDLGSSQALTRECSRNENSLPAFFRSVMTIKLVCTLPAWVAVTVISAYWFPAGSAPMATMLLVIAVAAATPFLDSFSGPMSAVTQVKHRMDIFSKWRSGYFLAVFVFFFWLSRNAAGVLQISGAYLAVTGIALLLFLWQLRKYLATPECPAHAGIGIVLKHGAPFLLTSALALAYYRLDVTLLGALGSAQAAGIYSAQYQVILLMYSVSAIVFNVAFPDLYRNSHDHLYLTTQFRRISRYLNLLAWLTTPLFFLYAREIMLLLGGERFTQQHEGLRILSLFIPMYVFAVALNFLTSLDDLRARIRCETWGVALTGIGGLVAIPAFSVAGMATVAIFSYMVSGVYALRILQKKHGFHLRPVASDFVQMGLKASPAFLALLIPDLAWWLKSMLFGGLFFLSLTMLHFWDAQDKNLATRIKNMILPSQA